MEQLCPQGCLKAALGAVLEGTVSWAAGHCPCPPQAPPCWHMTAGVGESWANTEEIWGIHEDSNILFKFDIPSLTHYHPCFVLFFCF